MFYYIILVVLCNQYVSCNNWNGSELTPKLPSYVIRRIYVSTEMKLIQRMYHCNNKSCICCSLISCDVHRSRKWIHEDWNRQTRSAYGNSAEHVSQYCMSNFLPNILMLSPLENDLSTVNRLIDTVSRLIDTVSRLIDTVSRLIENWRSAGLFL